VAFFVLTTLRAPFPATLRSSSRPAAMAAFASPRGAAVAARAASADSDDSPPRGLGVDSPADAVAALDVEAVQPEVPVRARPRAGQRRATDMPATTKCCIGGCAPLRQPRHGPPRRVRERSERIVASPRGREALAPPRPPYRSFPSSFGLTKTLRCARSFARAQEGSWPKTLVLALVLVASLSGVLFGYDASSINDACVPSRLCKAQ